MLGVAHPSSTLAPLQDLDHSFEARPNCGPSSNARVVVRLDLLVGQYPLPLAWHPQLQLLADMPIRHQEHLLNRPGR